MSHATPVSAYRERRRTRQVGEEARQAWVEEMIQGVDSRNRRHDDAEAVGCYASSRFLLLLLHLAIDSAGGVVDALEEERAGRTVVGHGTAEHY